MGQTPTPDQVGQALAQERARDVDRRPSSRTEPGNPTVPPPRRSVGPAAVLLLVFTGLIAAGLFFAFSA